MKLEVGMYVRTKDGAIAKVEQIIDNEIHFNIKPIFSDGECLGYNWFYIKDVVKASNNIIDLIEVGDYVNGEKIDVIENSQLFNYNSYDGWKVNITPTDNKTISIVTSEQFSQMEYKVGD